MFDVPEESIEKLKSEVKGWRKKAVVELDRYYFPYKVLSDIEKKMKKVKEYWVEIRNGVLRIYYETKVGKGFYEIHSLIEFPSEHVLKGAWKEGALRFEVGSF
jgi:hypothetical protein